MNEVESKKENQVKDFVQIAKSYLTKTNLYIAGLVLGVLLVFSTFMTWHKAEFSYGEGFFKVSYDDTYTGNSLNKSSFGKSDVADFKSDADFGGIYSFFGGFLVILFASVMIAGYVNKFYKFAPERMEKYLNYGIFFAPVISFLVGVIHLVGLKGTFPRAEDFSKAEKYFDFSYGFGLFFLLFVSVVAIVHLVYLYKSNFVSRPCILDVKKDAEELFSLLSKKVSEMKNDLDRKNEENRKKEVEEKSNTEDKK